MKIIGVLLIALGLVGLIYGGISWTRREKVIDFGSVEVTSEREKTLPVPPVVGGICLVAGIVLMMKSRRPA